MSETQGNIATTTEQGITTITFSHPKSNSLPGTLIMKLADEINRAAGNTEAKVIVLKSGGEKTFCAGASFDELLTIKDLESGIRYFSGFAAVINAIRKAPKFVIARIQGKAVGGGVGIAAAADYALAHESASVKLSELAIGIGPFVVGPAVERKTGTSAFTRLAVNAARWETAAWAREKGLYSEVFSSAEELDKAVTLLAMTLSFSNPEAMKELKKITWKGTENWDQLLMERAGISGRLVLSEFTVNAINKFKQK